MQRERFFKQYNQFAILFTHRANRDDVTNYIKEKFGSLFESDAEKEAGFAWIEDQFSLMLIKQEQAQNEGELSYQDAQIEMLAHLDSVPTIDNFIQQAKQAAAKGHVRQVELEQSDTASPSAEAKEVVVAEELTESPITEEVKNKPLQKTRLEIERERQRELGPFYVSPTLDLKPHGY
ncbi:hypothetical protein CTH30272_03089 [Allocatenococcus thiocycli]|nr:hypothetical protein CTH30272_03089 [Catenococcus thiocycli]